MRPPSARFHKFREPARHKPVERVMKIEAVALLLRKTNSTGEPLELPISVPRVRFLERPNS